MPNQKDETNQRDELKKRGLKLVDRQDMQSRGNCFVGAFFLTIGTVWASYKYGPPFDLNTFFWLAPLVLGACLVPVVISGLLRRSARKALGCLPMALFPFLLFATMGGSLCGTPVFAMYADGPELAAFSARDFGKYASGDVVRTDDVQAVIDQQTRLRNETLRLSALRTDIDRLSESSDGARQALSAAVDQAQKAVDARKLSDEEVWRLGSFVRAARSLGTPVSPAPTVAGSGPSRPSYQEYAVTRAELENAPALIAQRYPLWIKVMRWIRVL